MPDTINIAVDADVATLTLNRPAVRNAFNARMITELTEACSMLAHRSDIGIVVLSGAGRSFSAGADVEWMRASLQYSHEENLADALRMSDMFSALNTLPQAVVGRVHGAAVGGGMGLIAACDSVVAANDTVFGFTEAKLGIVPAVISRVVLPKIGRSWARALYLSAERFGAEEARTIGLVHWVCPEDELDAVVAARVSELRSSGPLAVRAAKSLVADLSGLDDLAMRVATAERIAALRVSPEGQEGLLAFLDKRAPAWRDD